jgi:predicted DNA-binding transcriptional regulator YafY
MALLVTLTASYVGTIQSGIQVMQHLGQAGAAEAMAKLRTHLEEVVEQKVLPQWQALQSSGDVP